MKKSKMGKKDQKWEAHYQSLVRFVKREGHARVPARHEEDSFRLGRWVLRQRQAKDELSKHRMKSLENVKGWYWSGQMAKWDRACALLDGFIKREGHARVPKLHIEGEFKLGVWVMHQREKYRRGALAKDRERYLNKVRGWDWYGKPNKLPEASVSEVAEGCWSVLFGRGLVAETSAFHLCVSGLYDLGLIRSNHAHSNSPLATYVKKGIKEAKKQGFLDTPKRKFVRAVLANAKDYTVDDWFLCVVNGADEEPVDKDTAIQNSLNWAVENFGLGSNRIRKNTAAYKNLEKAITSAVKKKELKRVGRKLVRA